MMRPRCVSAAAWFTHASPAIHRKLAAIPSANRSGNQSHTLGKARSSTSSTAVASTDRSISRAGPRARSSPRGERGDREDRDEVGAGVESDEGLVDPLVVEHQREQRHGESVTEARHRERDGGDDDELSPARILRSHGERFGTSGLP